MSSGLHRTDSGVLQLCLRLLRYAVRRWPGLLLLVSTMLLHTALEALKPWPLKILVDNVLGEQPMPSVMAELAARVPGAGTREELVALVVAATVVLFLIEWGLGLGTTYARVAFGQRMVYDLAADLFDHLQRLSLRFHTRRRVGDAIRRVTKDSSCVSVIVEDALVPMASAVLSLVTMFTIMWQLDVALTLLSLAVVPLMLAVVRGFGGPLMRRSYAHEEVEGKMYDVVEQTLSAMPAVQAFSGEDRADQRFQASTRAILGTELALVSLETYVQVLIGLATALGTAAIFWIGARHVLDGQLSLGAILVFLSYLASLYAPLESLSHLSSTVQAATGSARRVMEVLEEEREVVDRPGATPLVVDRGHVRLEGVTFGYDAQQPVLHDIWLEARPGQTVAIVGPTGAGKSTLVSLVPRFFDPWLGRVTIDGRDVRDVQLKTLRRQVALVLQEAFLFPLSIAENIAYGRPEASRNDIEAAARAANAHAFIERLPAGYDTVIGERGATLSGGERQRLAIARALLKDAPILILDEPTSALDAETEGLLLEALERLMHGRTTLLIAHRLSTIRGADWIVVLQHGRLVEAGTHADLLAKDGLYARFQRLQSPRPGAEHRLAASSAR